MQGTVASFDDRTRDGHVLTDDGVPLRFASAALADHVRHLRVGQRVFLETADEDVVFVGIWPER